MPRGEPERGAVARAVHTVVPEDLASALASDTGEAYPAVLATSRMIALMERAAGTLLRPFLHPGELSVGVLVDVRHTAPTPPGVEVVAEARYLGLDGGLYEFEVVARDPGGEIGRGRHRRAIVEAARLEAGASRRRG